MTNDALRIKWNMPYWVESALESADFRFVVEQVFECNLCDVHGNYHPEYYEKYKHSEEEDFPRCWSCEGKHYYRREVDLRDALEILKGETNEPDRNG